jgi:hypothetical protein
MTDDWSLIIYTTSIGVPWWLWTLVAARAILRRCVAAEQAREMGA